MINPTTLHALRPVPVADLARLRTPEAREALVIRACVGTAKEREEAMRAMRVRGQRRRRRAGR